MGTAAGGAGAAGAVPLVCLPPAGAGLSFFHPWLPDAAPFRLVPVDLPGRETRFAEDVASTMDAAVDAVLPGVLAAVGGPGPVVVYGHSFGALVGYELARRLAPRPVVLVASGSGGPKPDPLPPIAALPDEEFVAAVRLRTGYHHPAMDDPELRELVLPALRGDIALREAYRPAAVQPLPGPVLAVRGSADQLVSAAEAAEWRAATAARFSLREVPGGHMYPAESGGPLLALLREELYAWLR